MGEVIQVVCVVWGTKYGADDVNYMARAVRDGTDASIRFICVTDMDNGPLDEAIIAKPFPSFDHPFDEMKKGCRLKLSVFADGILDPDLPTVFLDMDTMVIGDVKRLAGAAAPGELAMMRNHYIQTWRWPTWLRLTVGKRYYFGNSSIMAFRQRDFAALFSSFNSELAATIGPVPKHLQSDERFISYFARDRVRVFSNRDAVVFSHEFMAPFLALAQTRSRLPSVKRRRSQLVAVTFVGDDVKPRYIADLKTGDVVTHKGQKMLWNQPHYSDYWRASLRGG